MSGKAYFSILAFVICGLAAVVLARPRSESSGRTADTSAQQIERGQKLFGARCGICHAAPHNTGSLMLARRLGKDRSLLADRTDLKADYIRKVSRVGIGSMPPLTRIEVPDSELDLIVTYLTRPESARTAERLRSSGAAHE
jgi:mono/diheme cytochrome c family protein